MQKKHLHLFLLLLALVGCSPRKFSEVNPYFAKQGSFALDLDRDTPAALLYQGLDLRVRGLSTPSFSLQCAPFIDGPWEAVWENARKEPLALSHRTTERSLMALALNDSVVGFAQHVIPLSDGQGAVFYLDSKVDGPFGFSLAMASDDTLWSHKARTLSNKLLAIDGPDSAVLVIGSDDGIVSAACTSPAEKAPLWELMLSKSRTPQVVLAFGWKLAEVRARVEKSLGLSAEKMEAAAISGLEQRARFSLHTSDERTNQAAALLSVALVGADARVPKNSRHQIEESSQCAAALFLASRQKPRMVFPPSEKFFTEQTKRDHLRWGSAAFHEALLWGMADDDTLRWLSLDVLSGLERLQSEYATSDVAVVADDAPQDSLMRLAVAHIRLAGLMALGEEIGFARGDHDAQITFRTASMWAGKRAQELFTKSAREYRNLQTPQRLRLETAMDTTLTDDASESDDPPVLGSIPDTALYLSAGARYGFSWIDARPALFWNPHLSVGGFTWQKWLAYRFRSDIKISETPDFDSLLVMILDGPFPGFLTSDPTLAGEPSVPVMGAAMQNFAEVYLGIRPDAFEHKLWIEPRIPSSWGHTAARVPFGTGLVHLDYDFGHDYAVVSMSGIQREIEVFFGYPLASGGFLRTQFSLVPGEHGQRITLRREKENRLELVVSDVP